MTNDASTALRDPAVVIGLDIGSAKTRGIKWRQGVIEVDAEVGSTNVQNVGCAEAAASLSDLFDRLAGPCPGGGTGVDEVYASSGGIDTEDDAAALTAMILPNVPGAVVRVVHDTRLLLAAAGASTGVAVIAGTGSAAWGTNDGGGQARAGGWGYLLGDEGSGYWFGREAVRHSLHQMNLGLEPDELTQALLTQCGLAAAGELIAHFHAGTGRRYWAGMSPPVFDAAAAGHAGSLAMIEKAGADLAMLAAQCARKLGIPGPLVLGGGLGMNQPMLQNAFREHLSAKGLTDVRVLEQDPIFGVLTLATS